ERHPVALPGAGGLPDRRGSFVPVDGVLADHRDRLGAHRRNRGAARDRGGAGRTAAIRKRGADWLLNGYAALALIYLLLPIAVIIVFSFNNPVGRFNFIWNEFSLEAWQHPFAVPRVQAPLKDSLQI